MILDVWIVAYTSTTLMEIADGDFRKPSYDPRVSVMSIERIICSTSWTVRVKYSN